MSESQVRAEIERLKRERDEFLKEGEASWRSDDELSRDHRLQSIRHYDHSIEALEYVLEGKEDDEN